MEFTQYIKPELLIMIPVLYIIGMAIKKSKIRDELIPLILGAAGIVLATLWIFATGAYDVADGIFAGVTQGILAAGASVYGNQIIKQITSYKATETDAVNDIYGEGKGEGGTVDDEDEGAASAIISGVYIDGLHMGAGEGNTKEAGETEQK